MDRPYNFSEDFTQKRWRVINFERRLFLKYRSIKLETMSRREAEKSYLLRKSKHLSVNATESTSCPTREIEGPRAFIDTWVWYTARVHFVFLKDSIQIFIFFLFKKIRSSWISQEKKRCLRNIRKFTKTEKLQKIYRVYRIRYCNFRKFVQSYIIRNFSRFVPNCSCALSHPSQ